MRDPDDVVEGEPAPASRRQQLVEIDRRIGQVIEDGPNGADFVVASLSDAGRSERLRLVVARGPHFGPGVLVSSSTKQKGLAQAPDVTATVLSVVGLPVPDAVAGSPLTSDPAPDNSERRAQARLTYLADYDEASHDVHDLVEPFFMVFAYGQLVIYLLVLLVYKGRLGSERTRVTTLSRVRVLSVAAACVPVSTFLANLLPWWRFPIDLLSVTVAVGLFVAIIATAALKGPWGKWALGPMAFVSATTMVVLAVDVMTGSRLQLSSLMGLQPVVGGRYYGMGNPTFALFATATILLCTAVSSMLLLAGRQKAAAVAVAAIGGAARRRRRDAVLGRRRWRPAGAGARAGLPDHRGARAEAHLEAAAPGGGRRRRPVLPHRRRRLAAAHRRRAATWAGSCRPSSTATPSTSSCARASRTSTSCSATRRSPCSCRPPCSSSSTCWRGPRRGGRGRCSGPTTRRPTLRAGLIALLITLTIGFLINDSGVAIPAVGATLAVPLIVSVSVSYLLDEARAAAQTRSARRRR